MDIEKMAKLPQAVAKLPSSWGNFAMSHFCEEIYLELHFSGQAQVDIEELKGGLVMVT